MSKARQRLKAQRRAAEHAQRNRARTRPCPNGCGADGPHYVPPSLGDPGFFLCDTTLEST